MNKKVLYVSDFFYEEVAGGGEANDKELLEILSKKHTILKYKSANVNLDIIKKHKDFLILSNFVLINPNILEYITNNCKYIIYEHDHKYIKSRNPAIYDNFIAPDQDIINKDLYKNASAVLCQSKFHKSILDKNLQNVNSISLSGNLWSEKTLELIEFLCKSNKSNSYAIMNSHIEHKNTLSSVKYCKVNDLEYQLINNAPHEQFLQSLSIHKGLVFLPKTPETLSRIAVESRMMNMSVITNKNLGASYEDWFKLKGNDLISVIRNKRIEIPSVVESYL